MHTIRRIASSRLAIAAIAVAVTATVVGGVAAAAIPDDAGVIHGCYNHSGGTLRVVDSGARCKPSEVALPWNQQGLQGAPGQPGPAGPTGPAGAPGPTGVAVTQVIPPASDPDNTGTTPLTLHLTTGTWHVTAESNGTPATGAGCTFAGTTGTILGVPLGFIGDVHVLVEVSAASATVTMACFGDPVTQVSFSENIFAVPVVMQ